MTRREAMRRVFAGGAPGRAVASIRLDLWHRDLVARKAVPAAIAGLSQEEVEDYLGWARAARYRSRPGLVFAEAACQTSRDGELSIETIGFPERPLVRRRRRTAEMERQGMAPHIVDYPLREERDYRLLLTHLEGARVSLDAGGFNTFDMATGDRGLPVFIVNSCPAHLVMLEWAGYEAFYGHLADFPDLVDETIGAIDRLYRRDLWPAVAGSRAELVIHGNHFSSQMTPPRQFRRWFSPYFRDFTARMHRHGKQVLWHADAEMGALLQEVLDAGFDGADCLATFPLVPQRLTDYLAAWQGRIVCWGGLPSVIFDPTFPEEEYRAMVGEAVALARSERGVILGASDNILPGAPWERLVFLAERLAG